MLNYNLVQYALYIKLYIFDNTTSILVSWYRTVGGFFNIKFRFSKENVKISLQNGVEWIWPKCINWNYFFAHFIDTVCKTKEFQCLNGGCIPAAYVCDTEKDCQDGSDEIDCQSGEKLWTPLNGINWSTYNWNLF